MRLKQFSFLVLTHFASVRSETFRLALIPKNSNNLFFESVFVGCNEEAELLSNKNSGTSQRNETSVGWWNVTCDFMPPASENENAIAESQQIEIIKNIGASRSHDAIAVAPLNGNNPVMVSLINSIMEKGIPVITYDEDSQKSNRLIYIGTDNFAFGDMLGKILLQLEPMGGEYSIITAFPAENLASRVKGIRNALDGTKWKYFGPDKGVDGKGSRSDSIAAMTDIFEQHVRNYTSNPNSRPPFAILPVGGWPMFDFNGWKEFNYNAKARGGKTTLICGDTFETQIDLLNMGFVDGLVGQLPSEMGRESVRYLTQYLHNKVGKTDDRTITNLLQFLRVPLVLPDADPDTNSLGLIKILSYILFGIVGLTVICLGVWTWKHQASKVVRSSQPIFLYLILAGALIMSATIVTLTFEDQNAVQETCGISGSSEDDSHREVISEENVACNLNFWFLSIGFTLIFAALFSKTWRLNRIIIASRQFKKVTITVKDVLMPLFAMLVAVVAVLLSWTLHDPLKYIPKKHPGTDEWNRPNSCYGVCGSKFATAYAVVMFLVVLFSLIMALVQAYQTRNYRTDFNESYHIGIATVSILQASIIGILIYGLSRNQPRIMVPIISLTIFFIAMSVILFIFVPKIISYRTEVKTKGTKRRFIMTYGAGVSMRTKEKFTVSRDLADAGLDSREEKSELYI